MVKDSGILDEQLRLLVSQYGLETVQQSLNSISSVDISLDEDKPHDSYDYNDCCGETKVDSSFAYYDNASQPIVQLLYKNRRDTTTPTSASLAVDSLIGSLLHNSSHDAAVVADEKGSLVQVNSQTVEMFGYESADALIGKNIDMLLVPRVETGEQGGTSVSKPEGDLSIQGQWTAKREDGSEFPCRLAAHQVPYSSSVLTIIRDATAETRVKQLTVQKEAAEHLLLNMLPKEIAHRLQSDPTHIADQFQHASILFADIVGFTRMSNSLAPIEVVKFLNSIFSRFDAKLDKYGLNKVKTIGDCYMVTSIPTLTKPAESSVAVCHFAMDMVRAIEDYNKENPDAQLNMRIGINTGSVVAGVVGTKRFLYDIWGDAVNIASRMESTGLPGKVQVTKAVVDLVEGADFAFERRGMVPVKGIGEMETYFVKEHNRKRAMRYWKTLRSSFIQDREEHKAMDIFEVLSLLKQNS